MDKFTSMTMPVLFFTSLLVLVVVGVGLYIVIRMAGQRRADAEHRPDIRRQRTDHDRDQH